jgi:hypothetical protein
MTNESIVDQCRVEKRMGEINDEDYSDLTDLRIYELPSCQVVLKEVRLNSLSEQKLLNEWEYFFLQKNCKEKDRKITDEYYRCEPTEVHYCHRLSRDRYRSHCYHWRNQFPNCHRHDQF